MQLKGKGLKPPRRGFSLVESDDEAKKVLGSMQQPNENATRYVYTPHVLKPNDADYFVVELIWPNHVEITGMYSVVTRLVTSEGEYDLERFNVPVLSDQVPVEEEPSIINAHRHKKIQTRYFFGKVAGPGKVSKEGESIETETGRKWYRGQTHCAAVFD